MQVNGHQGGGDVLSQGNGIVGSRESTFVRCGRVHEKYRILHGCSEIQQFYLVLRDLAITGTGGQGTLVSRKRGDHKARFLVFCSRADKAENHQEGLFLTASCIPVLCFAPVALCECRSRYERAVHLGHTRSRDRWLEMLNKNVHSFITSFLNILMFDDLFIFTQVEPTKHTVLPHPFLPCLFDLFASTEGTRSVGASRSRGGGSGREAQSLDATGPGQAD